MLINKKYVKQTENYLRVHPKRRKRRKLLSHHLLHRVQVAASRIRATSQIPASQTQPGRSGSGRRRKKNKSKRSAARKKRKVEAMGTSRIAFVFFVLVKKQTIKCEVKKYGINFI